MSEGIPEDLKPVLADIRANLKHDDLNDELSRSIHILNKQIGAIAQIIKGFSDLYVEMTDQTERRRWLERIVKKTERDAARTKLDLWFWRPEESLSVEKQVRKRAIHLTENKYSLDDTWDLLCEFVTDYAHRDLNIEWLKEQIKESFGA